ncbi:hypothetical protein SAMN04487969_13225 [Paenibacillus algorifonticola]|uniref:Uncharacterized protein n=1 Tax=Paenibacillus algorifonticola TaxID=684063 RepID=A0A1I2I936_9BACL|nr:hypothetical protein [Paenibacillus algorifonticola]SFF38765.1 hypothetical protein SAMN04487969_13225 [Paenibacillus algorifonticola]
MKKTTIRVVIGAALLLVGFGIGFLNPKAIEADGVSTTPGSIDDPVVTKSYIDEQLAKLSGGGSGAGNGSGSSSSGSNTDSSLKVVSVPSGKVLLGDEGTEIILRVGKAVAYSSDSSGIVDLTGGKDLVKGNTIASNHLLLMPRSGRGVTAAAGYTKSLTVLVRGEYKLQSVN